MNAVIAAEGGSSVKLKKLSGGRYGWDVTVEAASGSLEDLRAAKETARAISEELERELKGPVPEDVDVTGW